MVEAEPALRTALVVLGAHRSGTSAMARVLGLSGGRLPDDPMAPSSSNARGYWESQAVVAFNDEVLAAHDTSWDDIFGGQPRPYLSNFDRVFQQRAREVVEACFGGADLIVLKDPRINVLAGFWDAALRQDGYAPVYVVVVRHPAEVAASLLERDRMAVGQGLLLWLDQMLAAERDTRKARRVFVAYDDLLEDAQGCLDRIEAAWGRPLPRRTAAAQTAIAQFLSPSLRHHTSPAGTAKGRSAVQAMAAEAYAWFKAACVGPAPADAAPLDALRERLGQFREAFEPVTVTQRATVQEYVRHTRGLEDMRTHLSAMLEAAEAGRSALEQEVGELRASAAERDASAERIAAAEAQLHASMAERDASAERLAAVEAQLQDLATQLAAASAREAASGAELAGLRDADAALDGLLQDLRQALGREPPAEPAASAADRAQELAALLDLLAEREAAAGMRESLIEELSAALDQERASGTSGAAAQLETLEERYGVLSTELRRVQDVAEQALSQSRTLSARLKTQAEALAAQAAAAEVAEGEWRAERELMIRQADALSRRHSQDLDRLRQAHDAELAEQGRRRSAAEHDLGEELEALRRHGAETEREVLALRDERSKILASTSWKMAALPRRLMSRLRRG